MKVHTMVHRLHTVLENKWPLIVRPDMVMLFRNDSVIVFPSVSHNEQEAARPKERYKLTLRRTNTRHSRFYTSLARRT
jgi:hypothetical protein